jgi:methionyl aminopeptidase
MEAYNKYHEAGKIASQVRESARKKYYVGATLLQICESLEEEIRTRGAMPAFPVNVSLNEIAAHYTAEPADEQMVSYEDVLKIDIGVHIGGYIADTAVTVCYDPKYEPLVNAADIALKEAVRIAKVNAKASDIGRAIEMSISQQGFRPIQNLSGHSLEQFTIHAGRSIPNIRTFGSSFNLLANQAYAIEPFVTTKDGLGIVQEGKIRNIFGIISRKPLKDKEPDDFLASIWKKFKSLPFAIRWILNEYEEKKSRELLDILIRRKNVRAYPILVEGRRKIVAQAEHTIIPLNNFTDVITL